VRLSKTSEKWEDAMLSCAELGKKQEHSESKLMKLLHSIKFIVCKEYSKCTTRFMFMKIRHDAEKKHLQTIHESP
jgi:hypothetical protein